MLKEADKDGSGTVDFHEFVNLMSKRENEKETEDDLKQVFRVFDKVIDSFLFLSTKFFFVCNRMVMDIFPHQR